MNPSPDSTRIDKDGEIIIDKAVANVKGMSDWGWFYNSNVSLRKLNRMSILKYLIQEFLEQGYIKKNRAGRYETTEYGRLVGMWEKL